MFCKSDIISLAPTVYFGIVPFLALIFFVVPCHPQTPDTISVDINENGNRIGMVVGQILALHLEQGASGYRWDIVTKDKAILQPRDSTHIADDYQAPGSPVTKVWFFEAVGSGEMELKLVFHRPWQRDVDPDDEFKLHITVL